MSSRDNWPGRWVNVMRICSIALGFAGLFSVPAVAQGFGLGVKGGVNVATERFQGDDGSPGVDPRIGAVAGVFATLRVLSWLDLQSEALYAMKGTRLDLEGVQSNVWLDYLEVPILATVSRRRGGARRYFVAAGPSVGVRLRGRSRTKFADSTEEIDIGDELERLDFGVAAGGGVALGSIVLDGRYTLGLTDIDKDKTDTVTVTNRTISFTVGFKF
jgi:hypothetical protein